MVVTDPTQAQGDESEVQSVSLRERMEPAIINSVLVGLKTWSLEPFNGEHGHLLNGDGKTPVENLRRQFLRLEFIQRTVDLSEDAEDAGYTRELLKEEIHQLREELIVELRKHLASALSQREGRQLGLKNWKVNVQLRRCLAAIGGFIKLVQEVPLEELMAVRLDAHPGEEAEIAGLASAGGLDLVLMVLDLRPALEQLTQYERLACFAVCVELKEELGLDEDQAVIEWAALTPDQQTTATRMMRTKLANALGVASPA